MSEEKRVTLSKRERFNVSLRMTMNQAAWNYERMHNVGFAYSILPVIKKFYPEKEERTKALKRHLEFINTHPYVEAPIGGVILALEEERANGADVTDQAIQGVKVGMMGPLAGVGDPVFWGTLRPVLGAFAASLALSGSFFGPILFFLLWNIIRIAFIWYTQELGYRSGLEITKDLSGGILQKITVGASILGMFIMGVLVPRWTSMNFPLVLSQVDLDADAVVDFQGLVDQANANVLTVDKMKEIILNIQGGMSLDGVDVLTLQDVFNEILPGIMPLVLTFICIYFLRKRVSALSLIMIIFVVGIGLYALGIMG